MDVDETKAQLLGLLASGHYMPMRKRSLAKALEISDADYRRFRTLLEEMVESGELVQLKKGKFGLPEEAREKLAPPQPTFYHPDRAAKESEPEEEEEEDGPRETDVERFERLKKKESTVPKGARVGRIDIKRGGMGFLLSDPPGNDIFIAEEDLGGALSGDLVAVEVKRRHVEHRRRHSRYGGGGSTWSRPTARVVKILERAHPRIVGTFYAFHRGSDPRPPRGPVGYVVPDTRGMFGEIDVLADDRGEARDKDKVAVELVESIDSHRGGAKPTARVVKVFGSAGQADADISAILENFNVRKEFPKEVLEQAERVPDEIPEEELQQRVYYAHPVTFTIDPQDAKDHDDAVALRREPDGRYTLLVHIADVSYYVPEGSPIDEEARLRGTSVYLPGTVYPMLPQKLSNNMCSLKEGQLRLTKTARITYHSNFTPAEIHIERSYIRSAAFLTYNQVREALDDNKPELVRTPEIYEALKMMREFAIGLRRKRMADGSIDLELPEAKLLLDEKLEVKGWAKEEHHWAHELIEDMMLAANRAVAEYMVDHEIPSMYRIHEDPDDDALKRFAEFVREYGISIRPPLDRMKLKSVIERVKGKEFAHTIHMALLTSLKQARYASECSPHWALNFTRYLHFTSPIRRYPDLIVHRALDSRFAPGQKALPVKGKRRPGGEEGQKHFERLDFLRSLAAHCSLKEREAAAAEQEVIKFRQMQFLRKNLKESHPGVITGVRDFGLFVEMQDCFVEGLVRVQDLADDYYEYYENQHMLKGRRRHRQFRLGDHVDVRILNIDLGKKQVALEIV